MITRITIDRAGRIVLPKPIRDALRLEPGDALDLTCEGEGLTLTPIRPAAPLAKEQGMWVYRSGTPAPSVDLPDLIARAREERAADLLR